MTGKVRGTRKRSRLKVLAMTAILTTVSAASSVSIANRGANYVASVNYKDGKFVNTLPNKEYTIGDYVKMTWDFLLAGKDGRRPEKTLPVVAPEEFPSPPSQAIQYNWLGHSSLVVELEGKRILLDPVFSERASFSQWLGPKRFHPSPISLEKLPNIDAVLISHNHYDHLDKIVIDHLKGKDVLFHVPLGVAQLLIKWGVKKERIVEMDWWEEASVGEVKIVATPARHFSARGLFDRDKTLWVSWSIIGRKHKVFFSGDTGMTPQFTEIGERLGPFDITFIKMAAYDEQWPDIHLNPEEAVQAHVMLKGGRLVPIHWGTFDLALHSWREPIERIIAAAGKEGVSIILSGIGETVVPATHQNSYWWRNL